MSRRFGDGKRSAGRRLKKSAERGPDDRLHRRERIKRTTPPLSYLGTARADAGLAISLQLENAIGYGRCNLVEFLLSHLSRLDPQPAGGGVSRTSSAASSGKTADCLGWFTKPPQSHGVGLRAAAAWTIVSGVPAGLRPGAESGGVCPQDFRELSCQARRALRRMRRRPTLVSSFWKQAELFPLLA